MILKLKIWSELFCALSGMHAVFMSVVHGASSVEKKKLLVGALAEGFFLFCICLFFFVCCICSGGHFCFGFNYDGESQFCLKCMLRKALRVLDGIEQDLKL